MATYAPAVSWTTFERDGITHCTTVNGRMSVRAYGTIWWARDVWLKSQGLEPDGLIPGACGVRGCVKHTSVPQVSKKLLSFVGQEFPSGMVHPGNKSVKAYLRVCPVPGLRGPCIFTSYDFSNNTNMRHPDKTVRCLDYTCLNPWHGCNPCRTAVPYSPLRMGRPVSVPSTIQIPSNPVEVPTTPELIQPRGETTQPVQAAGTIQVPTKHEALLYRGKRFPSMRHAVAISGWTEDEIHRNMTKGGGEWAWET